MTFGTIIIFIGILFLLEAILPGFEVQLEILWPILFLIISITRMIKNKKLDVCTSTIFLIGIWYLLYNLNLIPTPFTKVIWPLLLIVFGVSIIGNSYKFQKAIRGNKEHGYLPSYYGVFSGIEEKVKTENFEGASLYAIFGGIDLDLSEIQLKKDVTICIYSIFGGTDLKLPKNVNVKMNASALFGGNENKASTKEKKENKTIYINCISIFGGTEIK